MIDLYDDDDLNKSNFTVLKALNYALHNYKALNRTLKS